MQLSPDTVALFAVFFDFLLTFGEDLQSCRINHQMRTLMPAERFKTDVNRLCPLADTCVIRQYSGPLSEQKWNQENPVLPVGSAGIYV